MRKKYEKADFEVVSLDFCDIVTASLGDGDNRRGDDTYGGIGQVTVTINGEEKSLDFINWGDETVVLLPFDVCPNEDSKLNEITIKSCTVGDFVIKNDSKILQGIKDKE